MATVMVDLSMSLDGFITGPNPDAAHALGTGQGSKLHDWYFNGTMPSPHNRMFKPAGKSQDVVDEMFTRTGAIVVGKKWYEIMNGWDGNHPVHGAAIFVLTHHVPESVPQGESSITFVTDGLESAIAHAKAAAGDKNVTVGGANVAQQCLKAGLLDGILIHLLPILLGDGVRLFDNLGDTPVELESTHVIEAPGVTHLRYRVVK